MLIKPKVPVFLLVDRSGSMQPGIEKLNHSVQEFVKSFADHENKGLDFCICYDSFDYEIEHHTNDDFISAGDLVGKLLQLSTRKGVTYLGTAVIHALEVTLNKKEQYKKSGQPYKQPYVVVFTDGMPEQEDEEKLREAKIKSKRLIMEENFTVVFVTLDTEEDFNKQVAEIASNRLYLDGQADLISISNISEIQNTFRYLSQSLINHAVGRHKSKRTI